LAFGERGSKLFAVAAIILGRKLRKRFEVGKQLLEAACDKLDIYRTQIQQYTMVRHLRESKVSRPQGGHSMKLVATYKILHLLIVLNLAVLRDVKVGWALNEHGSVTL
jgi:hypothetical protein